MLLMANFSDICPPPPGDPAERIEQALRDCERSLGVSLTIHDHLGLFRDEQDRPLLMGRHLHRHRFCRLQRGQTVMRCVAHCEKRVHAQAARRRKPFCSVCWKGLAEIVIPLLHDGSHLATLYCGAWRKAGSRPRWQGMKRRVQLREAYRQVPCWEAENASALTRQLELWGRGLVETVLALRLPLDPEDRQGRIRRFIARWAHEPLGLADLAEQLHLSISRTSHVVRQCCGESFQQLVMNERVARAKVLLQASSWSLEEISQRCGFTDAPYFSRVFKRSTGLSPGAWRKRHAGHPKTVLR
jgi:AraC-like DNA-binding protein